MQGNLFSELKKEDRTGTNSSKRVSPSLPLKFPVAPFEKTTPSAHLEVAQTRDRFAKRRLLARARAGAQEPMAEEEREAEERAPAA